MAFWYGLLFFVMLLLLIKSAAYATYLASRFARTFHLSEFLVSSLIVAFISTFPETTVALMSVYQGVPEFGMGTLLGSNVADLTLVFGIVALAASSGLRVQKRILKRHFLYTLLLILPVALGWDGYLSRAEGGFLIAGCAFLFYLLYRDGHHLGARREHPKRRLLTSILLLCSLAVLLVSAYYTVRFGMLFAEDVGVNPLIISLVVVSVGTCMPELFFSLRAARKGHYTMALGDIFGTVILDATLVVGVMALLSPFAFDPVIVYTAGLGMVLAGLLVTFFIVKDRALTKLDAVWLLLFYIAFLIVQFFVVGAA